jgi:hypothetical protein
MKTQITRNSVRPTTSASWGISIAWTLAGLIIAVVPGIAAAPVVEELVQVREDFSSDPGWDNWNNRVEFRDSPTVTQNFGWAATSHFGGEPGELGGTIWRSTTPAWYAMPLGQPSTPGRLLMIRKASRT